MNVAWTTIDLPSGWEQRTLRLSLHNLTRSLRQYGALREYHFELSIELSHERPRRQETKEAPLACLGGYEEDNRGQDVEEDDGYFARLLELARSH